MPEGPGHARGPRTCPRAPSRATGPSEKNRDQAAELPVLDEDVEEEEEDDEEDDDAAEAAGFASDEPEAVEDFDADDAGELLDDEPRLSFR